MAYAAVNTFMDVFVQQYNKNHNYPWMSIDWDGWQSNKQVTVNNQTFGEEISGLEISAEEGITAFRHLLSAKEWSQIVVSTVELQPRINLWVKRGLATSRDSIKQKKIQKSNNYVAPRNTTEAQIASIYKLLLGVQEVSVHDSFLEIGGDSLTGTQLLSKLKQNFAVNLPINTVFESPTIAELAKVIDNEQETGEDDMDKISNTAIIGLEWWQIDLGSWIIWILEKTGLIWDVKRPTASMIKARKFSQ